MKKKTNILFFLRFYSGLQQSFFTNSWKPSGVPAISNLLEEINNHDFNSIVIFYSFEIKKSIKKNLVYKFSNLNNKFLILQPPRWVNFFPYKLYIFFSYLYFGIKTLILTLKYNSDVLYTDRSNMIGAALSKLINKNVKVVIRFLGMPNSLLNYIGSNKIIPFLMRLSLKMKYDLIIGTEDGSSIKSFFDTYLINQPNKFLKVNGVSKHKFSNLKLGRKIKILCVSRLEKNKNIHILIHSLRQIPPKLKNFFELEIIGHGTEKSNLLYLCKQLKLKKLVNFHGNKENDYVVKKLSRSDVYISCNEFGQLSNSNLEAISAGLCIILMKTLRTNDQRIEEKLLGENNLIWFEKDELGKNLAKKILNLIENPNKIKIYKKKTRDLSTILPSIKKRIIWEIDEIKKLMRH